MNISARVKLYAAGTANLLILALLMCVAGEVKAQWTTPDGNGNINSTNTGNVGVGNTAPKYKLDILGSANNAQIRFGLDSSDSGGFLFSIQPSHATFAAGASWSNFGWTARAMNSSSVTSDNGNLRFYSNTGLSPGNPFTPTERMTINPFGLVGIGTAIPSSRLHVVSGTDTNTSMLTLDTGVHGGTTMSVAGTPNNESTLDMSVYRAGSYISRFGVTAAGNVYLQPGSGNVGVGTITPDTFAKMHLYGSGGFGQDIQTTTNDWTRLRFIAPSRTWGFFLDSQSTGLLPQGSFGLYDYTANAFRMAFHTNGNVGIGVNNPAHRLDVAGTIRSSSGGFVFPDGTVQTTAAAGGGGSGTITGVTAGSGLTGGGTTGALTLNVGAGTGVTVAADTIAVNYGSTAGTAVQGNTSITVAAGTGMSGGGALTLGAGGTVTLNNADGGSAQPIFKTIANSAGTTQFSAQSNTDVLRIAGAGGTTVSFDSANKKVTIDGSTSTVSAANITAGSFASGTYTFPGNVTVNGTLEGGNIKAKYQDMAEWVESSQELSAGTVVVLDSNRSNQVVAATQSYDSRVAGVISLQPGIALGEEAEGRVLVATTGRVKVKVDASNSPIKIGDLLVTSEREGFAMKSLPVEFGGIKMHRPGTLIGKALEPLDKGTGEILVLLSLQ
ncbi:MAG TPA: hypothetical protein VKB05_04475 [Pyrinomonadaceae bacterium]|nr:hypothetical protein [Pyrinomonadaceae bacterium]